ncbi:hypothetical protein BpHYR1_007984 [Brachionus plicatilis]|uniref:Uncharacterized protein n=1 Tax=Brachionus plicatilis TaxID=10195 RepID=A0A3M7Q6I9_BRAPC|nr:hypothetical protein BpHYR1_007984 [Brachionus plicatilis]
MNIMFSLIRCSLTKDSKNLSNPLHKINPKNFTISIKKQNSSIRKMGKKNKRYQFKSLKLLILNTTLNFTLKLPVEATLCMFFTYLEKKTKI